MGAEIYGVQINFDGVIIAYGTKVTSKKNKDSKTTLTFDGDVSTSGKNTGGTISIERLVWPSDIDDFIALEKKLEESDIKSITNKIDPTLPIETQIKEALKLLLK